METFASTGHTLIEIVGYMLIWLFVVSIPTAMIAKGVMYLREAMAWRKLEKALDAEIARAEAEIDRLADRVQADDAPPDIEIPARNP